MGREIFLLLFVLGSGALAMWVALRFPVLAPASLRSTGVHLAVAVVVGSVLGPVLHTVPGLPSEPNAWKVDLDGDGNVVGLF